MKLTKRVLGMSPSLPRKLFDMAKEIGGDVIDLTLGDPDVPPPANVRAAACAAIAANAATKRNGRRATEDVVSFMVRIVA